MPTYEYECQHCHERVEAVQKFSDAALTVCPLCGGELRKVFSAVGIVFKGSGFYKNDSRKSGSSAIPARPRSTSARVRRRPNPRGTAPPDARSRRDSKDARRQLRLSARDRDPIDRESGRTAPPGNHSISSPTYDEVEQHSLERRGNRQLSDGLSELPVSNHEPGHSDREVARDRDSPQSARP